MPNWNYNRMTFHAPNETAKKQLHTLVDKHIKFNNNCEPYFDNESILPNQRDWGSKWGFCDECYLEDYSENHEQLHEVIDNEDGFVIHANAAWCPPIGLIKKLLELYPDIEFTNEWGEEQVTESYGIMTYDNVFGFNEEEPDGIELWNMLYKLNLVDTENPEESYKWCLNEDGSISPK